ncbi:CoA transferase [Homoserinibacter sp. GY 40078]|nr:CoA transferase [Homoserinibacter sp. GY 40078]
MLVADFSRVLAGPLCTMMLADLGAEVIKVEHPTRGDDTRSWGPPFTPRGSSYFDSVNRGKRSVRLDLNSPADRDRALALALRADVVVENFRSGTMERFGLGFEQLRSHKRGVIYVSISGFGSAPAGRLRPGYDLLAQAVGGLMSITGPPGEPTKSGVAVVDVLTGKDAAIGVLAALHARTRTGEGAHIEVNLLSSVQSALVNQVQGFLSAGTEPRALGNTHPSISPYELLHCADGEIVVACGTDAQFARLCGSLGAPELAGDPRYVGNENRVAHREDLRRELERLLASAGADEWEQIIADAGVPVGRVGTVSSGLALADELGLEPLIEVVDDEGATTRQVRSPITWKPAFPPQRHAPPTLGQHDDELREWLADAGDPRPSPPTTWSADARSS